MFEGIFFLMITFPELPPKPVFNPYGPIEFSTYTDCRQAGETLSAWITRKYSYTISCSSKETGKVHATWGLGPIIEE